MGDKETVVWLAIFLALSLGLNVAALALGVPMLALRSKLRRAVGECVGERRLGEQVALGEAPDFSPTYDPAVALYGLRLLHNFEIAFATPGESMLLPPNGYIVAYAGRYQCCMVRDERARLWLLFRGTHGREEAKLDMQIDQENEVHRGFDTLFERTHAELKKEIASAVQILMFGHSLGAALLTLALQRTELISGQQCVGYGFGSPRVGSPAFADAFAAKKHNYFNVQNEDDIITSLPPAVCPNLSDPSTPLQYAHVGQQVVFAANRYTWFANHMLPIYGDFLEAEATRNEPPAQG